MGALNPSVDFVGGLNPSGLLSCQMLSLLSAAICAVEVTKFDSIQLRSKNSSMDEHLGAE